MISKINFQGLHIQRTKENERVLSKIVSDHKTKEILESGLEKINTSLNRLNKDAYLEVSESDTQNSDRKIYELKLKKPDGKNAIAHTYLCQPYDNSDASKVHFLNDIRSALSILREKMLDYYVSVQDIFSRYK